jgi:iron complex outermembrane receptor protein
MRSLASLAVLLVALPVMAAVEGRVVTPENAPVEGARVELADGSAHRTTDARGAFRFAEIEPPVAVRVVHPRFQLLETECCGEGGGVLVLEPKQQVYGEVVVTANREADMSVQPLSVATSSVDVGDRPAPVQSVVELAQGIPSVAESGQGGLFQAYSIRGTGGQRVLSLVAGTRVLTERRAGATASFIDPLLLASANVVRGPYSSYYGSGAIGGVLEAVPRRFTAPVFAAGWESQGDANYQLVGLALSGWSLGVARRASNPTETPDGELLPSQFEQYSATVDKVWVLASGLELDLTLIPSFAEDIGKPNRRFPRRTTTYPNERHLVTRLAFRRPGVWHLDFYGHPNTLETENLTAEERSVVDSEAFDFGFNFQREVALTRGFAARAGVDYFGRRGVQASETVTDLATGTVDSFTTLDGQQDELAAYGSLRRSFGVLAAEIGGRWTWIEQGNAGSDSVDDSAVTGFLGLSLPIGGGLEMVANAGTGFRFPGLSERFFSGSTGRGEVVANSALDPERSLTTDVGLRFFGSRLFVAAYLYRTEIDDYIERIDIEPGVRTFVNLTAGTIEGFEIEGFVLASDALRVEWSGQLTDGEADDGTQLAESPADRFTIGGSYVRGPWSGAVRWQHRFEKDDPGPGEVATDSADIVSASLAYRLSNRLALRLFGSNLLDETYLPSADELAVPAAGRSVGLGVSWGD